jgi:hypothetical protein
MSLPCRRFPLRSVPAVVPTILCCAVALAGCGADGRPAPRVPVRAAGDQQVRDVVKSLAQAYAAEDYRQLCAQFAPETFTEALATLKLDSCEALFRKMPSFEAPSPQQINAADVRVRGDRATIAFVEPGVEPMFLARIGGRWLITNQAEVTKH